MHHDDFEVIVQGKLFGTRDAYTDTDGDGDGIFEGFVPLGLLVDLGVNDMEEGH